MKNPVTKAFVFYVYAFILIFMINSVVMAVMSKAGMPLGAGRIFSYIFTPAGMFFAYRFSTKKFLGDRIDESKIPVAWLYQFIPFFLISTVVFYLLAVIIKNPPLAVFLFLNAEVLVVYVTFKFSVERKLLEKKG